MWKIYLCIIIISSFSKYGHCETTPKFVPTKKDSYLDAFKLSHKKNLASLYTVKKDREYIVPHSDGFFGGFPDEIYDHSNEYGPPSIYGPPKSSNGYKPSSDYKPPNGYEISNGYDLTNGFESSNGPNKHHYGPPSNIYGPPNNNYGPPNGNYGPPVYGMPHSMMGILEKFMFKLDLFTIGKILLKIVIFKKIVSLIAILCLLLFIPTLKSKKDEPMMDDARKFNNGKNRCFLLYYSHIFLI